MGKFIRIKEVAELLGIGESTAWLWVKEEKLPKPRKLSPRVTVWKQSEIIAYMENVMGGAA